MTLLLAALPFNGLFASAEQIEPSAECQDSFFVVEELEQYRTEFTKTYLKSDGTLEAVVSSPPYILKKMANGLK